MILTAPQAAILSSNLTNIERRVDFMTLALWGFVNRKRWCVTSEGHDALRRHYQEAR